MSPLGIGPRDVVSLARHSRRTLSPKGPILVTGVLAEQLATELRAGGDASLVRTHGDPAEAAAVVCVVGEGATPSDEQVLRAATRALVPVIGVRTGSSGAPIPYILATDVVDVPPGQGFPVDEIAGTLAAALGVDGAPLAGALPVLRDADHGDERARCGAQHLFVRRRGAFAYHADDRGGLGRIAVRAHE